MNFLWAHKAALAIAASWVWSRLRLALPTLGTPNFYRTWLYDFVKGNSAAKQPPV